MVGDDMDLTAIPALAEGAIYRTLDNEAVILNVDDGHYYVLNETATAIWNLCNGRRSLQDIAALLCGEYDVSPESARASVIRLMSDLVQVHLVVLNRPADA